MRRDQNAKTAADYLHRGSEAALEGEYDKAIADFDQALSIDPKNAGAYLNRGLVWYDKGEYDMAIGDFTKALALDPNDAGTYRFRGVAWERKSDYGKAIADYAKAAKIDPKIDLAYDDLAMIYATCPDAKYRDGKKAVENAKKSQRLSGGPKWGNLAVLAAAYAEGGDFVKAREFEEEAIAMAPDFIKPDLRYRLKLYKQGKPYHEKPVKK